VEKEKKRTETKTTTKRNSPSLWRQYKKAETTSGTVRPLFGDIRVVPSWLTDAQDLRATALIFIHAMKEKKKERKKDNDDNNSNTQNKNST